MRIRESILAIIASLAAAFIVQIILAVLFRVVVYQSAWLGDHVATTRTVASAVVFLLPAVAAGMSLGRLLPARPIEHVIALGVASPVLMYSLVGPPALAIGWQVAGYAAQLCVIGVIAIRVYDRRHESHGGLRGAV